MDALLLKQSFEQIKPHKEAFAEAFYNRLFELYPQTLPFFATTDMKRQQHSLMNTLSMVVANIAHQENLVPALERLGYLHGRHGVKAEHYPLVGHILLETFEQFLGEQWTLEMEAAWTNAYQIVAFHMKQGGGAALKLDTM